MKRPPESASRDMAVIAVMAGVRPGICMIAVPRRIFEVRAAMKDARALLLPSYAEGLPVVIMEALALGRPVISTYIAGIPELLDEGCGWIIPAGSETALVEAMRAALAETPAALAAKGAEGRRRIDEAHDVDAEAAKLKALFEAAQDAAAAG